MANPLLRARRLLHPRTPAATSTRLIRNALRVCFTCAITMNADFMSLPFGHGKQNAQDLFWLYGTVRRMPRTCSGCTARVVFDGSRPGLVARGRQRSATSRTTHTVVPPSHTALQPSDALKGNHRQRWYGANRCVVRRPRRPRPCRIVVLRTTRDLRATALD